MTGPRNMATTLKRVTEAAELAGIHALQCANLRRRLPGDEPLREGFLTTEYTPAFLEALHAIAPAIVAVDGGAVVGYALVVPPDARALGPALDGLYGSIDAAIQAGELARGRRDVVCGAICVAKSHRGLGLVTRLYAFMREELAAGYDGVVTDIARENTRSLAAHRRAGFDVRSSIAYEGQTWDLVACDWGRPAGR